MTSALVLFRKAPWFEAKWSVRPYGGRGTRKYCQHLLAGNGTHGSRSVRNNWSVYAFNISAFIETAAGFSWCSFYNRETLYVKVSVSTRKYETKILRKRRGALRCGPTLLPEVVLRYHDACAHRNGWVLNPAEQLCVREVPLYCFLFLTLFSFLPASVLRVSARAVLAPVPVWGGSWSFELLLQVRINASRNTIAFPD